MLTEDILRAMKDLDGLKNHKHNAVDIPMGDGTSIESNIKKLQATVGESNSRLIDTVNKSIKLL